MNMASQSSSDEIRTRVLTENTAQSVLKVLKALESNRQRMRRGGFGNSCRTHATPRLTPMTL